MPRDVALIVLEATLGGAVPDSGPVTPITSNPIGGGLRLAVPVGEVPIRLFAALRFSAPSNT